MMVALDFWSLSGRSCSITGFFVALAHQAQHVHSPCTRSHWTIHSFYFSQQKGRIQFCLSLFLFFFSLLVVRDKLGSSGKMLWLCNHGSMSAIHLGIGHITGWTVSDQVRQVAPPSQQANIDVIICQDDVISKKILLFLDSLGQITYKLTPNTI